jgi:ParB family transcriptional regulator, chromosome partitioning protein
MSAKRGGLGRNLSVLLGNSENAQPEPRLVPHTLPIENLIPGKYQPRNNMNEQALTELANSIKQQGLLQPIVVRMVEEKGCYEIIAGERRWRACKLAGIDTVPVIIKQVDNETAMALALIENLRREDLNPIDQARAIQRLNEEFSLTHQQIAELLSKSRAGVSNYLRLLSLAEPVLSMVEYGDLDMGHARALLSLHANQQIQIAETIVAKNLTVRETEKLINRIKKNPQYKEPTLDTISPNIQNFLEILSQQLTSKIHLKQGKNGKGSLVIQYNSLCELEKLFQQLHMGSAV